MTQNEYGKANEKIIVTVDSDLEDLIPGYLENRIKDIELIKAALNQGDYQTIQALGHSMKGSGGGYGFTDITTIGSALEKVSKTKDFAEIQRQVDELSAYLKKVEIVFEDD